MKERKKETKKFSINLFTNYIRRLYFNNLNRYKMKNFVSLFRLVGYEILTNLFYFFFKGKMNECC